jgi:hypothetical protein
MNYAPKEVSVILQDTACCCAVQSQFITTLQPHELEGRVAAMVSVEKQRLRLEIELLKYIYTRKKSFVNNVVIDAEVMDKLVI